jgi:ATP-dependent Clp protease ATP-binding subunit ClpC
VRRERDDRPPLERLISIGCTDLVARAQAGTLERAFGRDVELQQIAQSLIEKRSVLLQGPAEVGKTALIHELACRMARKQGPAALHGKHIVAISTGGILAGTEYLGDWQTRLTDLLEAVKQASNVLLYIEDIWGIRDAGRASDKADGFATLIRPYLERQDVTLLGETTPENFVSGPHRSRGLADEYSLMKCFNVISVDETSPEATRGILVGVSRQLQRAHHVRIEPSAIERGLELTRRFLPYRAFPGKAVRLLEETARRHGLGEPARADVPTSNGEVVLDADFVSAGFSKMTGLPEKIISDRIPLTQEEIREYFEERIVGQDEAVSAVASVVTLVKAELHDLNRPLGVLFFVGPTGVGKTELAKTLAEYLFGSKDRLIRFDMSEYKTFTSLDDLLEQLTEKQRRQSFSVLLLDEFEKAGPWVFDLFLSAFDDARLTDSSGRSVDLRNTIVIMTSNLGSEVQNPRPAPALGFVQSQEQQADAAEQLRAGFLSAVHAAFRPEFVNRLDKIVVFQPLGIEEMRRIARRELGRALILPGRLGVSRRNILLDFREEVLDVLLREGFSPVYGARPLQRAIKELVLLPLAQKIAAQPSIGDQLLELGVKDGRIVAEVIPVGPTLAAVQPEKAHDHPPERVTVRESAEGRDRVMDARQLDRAVDDLLSRVERDVESEQYRALQDRAQALLDQMGQPNFWDDRTRMRQTLSTAHRLKLVADRFPELHNRAEGLREKARMIRMHGDAGGHRELASDYESLERDIALAELELMAGDEAGAAGDGAYICVTPLSMPRTADATEWVPSLTEMYTAWAERKGYEVDSVRQDGAQSVLLVLGTNVARILLGENGIHKLHKERPSPPGSAGARTQVQLARVEVLPIMLAIGDGDGAARNPERPTVRVVEAFHGATGPTRRRGTERAEEVAGALSDARALRPARGGAMEADEVLARVYYLARSQYVRDPRTGHREGRSRDVLRGAIDGFLYAFLKWEQEREANAATAVTPQVTTQKRDAAQQTSRARREAAARTSHAATTRKAASPTPGA